MTQSNILKYNKKNLIWDFIKGFAGLLIVLLPLLIGQPVPWVGWLLAGLSILFIVFLGRVYLRSVTEITHDYAKLQQLKPRPKTLDWDKLNKLKLRYYSTKRTGENGWMFLQLKAGNICINLDSHLDGFDDILNHASKAAIKQDLQLDRITVANLKAFGINAE